MPYTSTTGAIGFIAPDENAIFSLKNGNAVNMISGEGWKSEDAVVTNYRIYYNNSAGLSSKRNSEEIVDIKDVTGVKISTLDPKYWLIIGGFIGLCGLICSAIAMEFGIFFIFLGVALMFIPIYFATKKSYLCIEYAGGSIHFSVKQYSMENVRQFQRLIFSIKDSMK